MDVTVTNTGQAVWLAPDAEYGGVAVGVHVYDQSGQLVTFDSVRQRLTEPPREIAPGETAACRLVLPPLAPGRYILEIDCVAARVTWFAQIGSAPARLPVNVVATA